MRRLSVAVLAGLSVVVPAFAAEEPTTGEVGWTSLSDLSHWEAYRGGKIGPQWKAEAGGVLHLTGGGGGDLVTDRDYGSFVLEFEWKISKGGNSGVLYRVVRTAQPPYHTGPEYQVFDSAGAKPTTHSAAALYDLYVAEGAEPKPAGEWNTAKITIEGDKVEHFLNGRKVVSTTIGGDDWNARLAKSKFADWKGFAEAARGRISLQDHDSEGWYRNVRIKPLD